MNGLLEIFQNKVLLISATSWFIAGVLKMLVELRVNKVFSISRIMGAGGMPSSHTSTVVSLVVSLGYYSGLSSGVFAVATILAIIVIHDAVGVRLETGKQAKVLNTMMFHSSAFKDLDFEKQLKEYVGHTPSQAFVGAIVGILVSITMINLVFK